MNSNLIKTIIQRFKGHVKEDNYLGLLDDATELLTHVQDVIEYEVDEEHKYRRIEKELSDQITSSGKPNTGSYCEVQAKADISYKNYRQAVLTRESIYETIAIAKKLAGGINNKFNNF